MNDSWRVNSFLTVSMQNACLRWIEDQLKGSKSNATWEQFLWLAACPACSLDHDYHFRDIFKVLVLFLEKLTGNQPMPVGEHVELSYSWRLFAAFFE